MYFVQQNLEFTLDFSSYVSLFYLYAFCDVLDIYFVHWYNNLAELIEIIEQKWKEIGGRRIHALEKCICN